jgi:hypothetical protein
LSNRAAWSRRAGILGAAWALGAGSAWAQAPAWPRVAWQPPAIEQQTTLGSDYYAPRPAQAPPASPGVGFRPASQASPQTAPAQPIAAPAGQPTFGPPPMTDGHWPHGGAIPPAERFGNVWPKNLPCDLATEDGYHTCDGHFFRYDLLLFTASTPQDGVLGDAGSEHYVVIDGQVVWLANSLTLQWDDWAVDAAHRIEFGNICGHHGWMANVWWGTQNQSISGQGVTMVFRDPEGYLLGYSDADGDGIDDDINLNNTYGRHGVDLGTPNPDYPPTLPPYIAPFDGEIDQAAAPDTGDLLEYQVIFSQLTARNELQLFGTEWMGVHRADWATPLHGLDLYYGVRYLDVEDVFAVTATGGELGDSAWAVDADNRIVGPQIGGRWWLARGRTTFGVEGRFLAGANFQRTELSGNIASQAQPGRQNHPTFLVPNSFSSVIDETEFSAVGEVRLDAAYHAYDWLAFRVGYNALLVGGVSRASGKVIYELPSFTLTNANSQDTLFISALTLGVEVRH